MTDENAPVSLTKFNKMPSDASIDSLRKNPHAALWKGNRDVFTDLYVSAKVEIESEDCAFKIYIRLNAKNKRASTTFRSSIVFLTLTVSITIFSIPGTLPAAE